MHDEDEDSVVSSEATTLLTVSVIAVLLMFVAAPLPQIVAVGAFATAIVRHDELGSWPVVVIGVLGVLAVVSCYPLANSFVS